MSGKNAKKNTGKFPWGIAAVIVCLAAVCAALVWFLWQPQTPDTPTQPSHQSSETVTENAAADSTATDPARIDAVEAVGIDLGNGMILTDVGSYTGIYMEDGTDELVSGVMMIAVTNTGESAIQYAEITLPVGDQQAAFSLTTLPVGGTVILLEQNRMEYVPGDYTVAQASNVALFTQPLSLCEDKIEIQILDGAINITNISGADITGDVVIYYKNSAADAYYGGITYRVRLEGGLRDGEIRQIVASHFSDTGSTIMFVTCGEG